MDHFAAALAVFAPPLRLVQNAGRTQPISGSPHAKCETADTGVVHEIAACLPATTAVACILRNVARRHCARLIIYLWRDEIQFVRVGRRLTSTTAHIRARTPLSIFSYFRTLLLSSFHGQQNARPTNRGPKMADREEYSSPAATHFLTLLIFIPIEPQNPNANSCWPRYRKCPQKLELVIIIIVIYLLIKHRHIKYNQYKKD